MKNNDQNEIRQGRAQKLHWARPTDALVVPEVVARNNDKLVLRSRPKRRINYEKKIINDNFLFNV